MAEPSTHNNYSLEDIQRYLQGKMAAAEMHDIEKASLQDPFLADAIEGFNDINFTTAKQHLNEINASLLRKKKESKVVALNKKTRWLNVAALIIVLAGIGVVASFFFKSSNKEIAIARVKTSVQNNLPPTDSSAKTITAPAEKQDSIMFIAQNKSKPSPKKIFEKDNAYTQAAVSSLNSAPVNQDVTAQTPNPIAMNNSNDTEPKALSARISGVRIFPSTFSGKVTDENNKPIPGALVESSDKSIATVTDVNGDFSLQQTDTALNIITSTIGYDKKDTILKPNQSVAIVLRGTTTALNDVVTVGYGTAKNKNVIKKDKSTATPVGGWENFNSYVLKQLNKDTTNNGITNPEDEVEIEFLVDNLGNPYNFDITKSSNENQNGKAINILKNGPKWTTTSKKKKAKLSIRF